MSSKPSVNEPTRYDKCAAATAITSITSDSKVIAVWFGMVWYGVASSLLLLKCVYACLLSFTLRYLFTHTAHYHSKYRVWHIRMPALNLAWLFGVLSCTYTNRPKLLRLTFFFDTHSLTHSFDSFALLYSPCVFDLFAICCWLKLKLCEYVRMNKLSRETMTTTMGTLIRFPKVKNPTAKYHILYRRNHVISRSFHTILVSQPPSPSL